MATEERDAEKLLAITEELRARLRKEEARHNEELRQFAYAMSHDLREPLRMVTSYTQLLQRRYLSSLDTDGREFVGFIVEAVQRMEQLLADLLTYSHQFRSAEDPLSLIDVEAVLQGVLLTLESEIRKSGAEISHDPLPQVMFDFGRLSQVFRQLVTNAIKFRGTDPPRIHISAKETDSETTFVVCDNGIGIEPRYHEQIFGIFRRLQGKESPGTGIGLAICKRIVEQHGGRVWVESEAGNGAKFHFTVPQ
jgi:light-regulated signal transduction histidine kinase (bacteriophytochrome)